MNEMHRKNFEIPRDDLNNLYSAETNRNTEILEGWPNIIDYVNEIYKIRSLQNKSNSLKYNVFEMIPNYD